MPNYFTQYWTNRQWDWERLQKIGYIAWPFPGAESPEQRKARKAAEKSNVLAHTAGNQFRSAGVRPGDRVFIVTVKRGLLHLGGKIVVDRICGQREAASSLDASRASYMKHGNTLLPRSLWAYTDTTL